MINSLISILNYFFSFSPDKSFPTQWIPWISTGFGIFFAIFLIYKTRTCKENVLRKILQKYPSKFLTISLLLAINILARTHQIEVLSMRIFTYILMIWLLYIKFQLYRDFRITYPEQKKRLNTKKEKTERKYNIHKNKSRKGKQKKRKK